VSPTHQSPWTPTPWEYFFMFFAGKYLNVGIKVRAIRWLP